MAAPKQLSAVLLNANAKVSLDLKNLLDECKDIVVLGVTPNLKDGLLLLEKLQPDMFFLDENTLSEERGISVELLSKSNPKTYFVLIKTDQNLLINSPEHRIPEQTAVPFDRNKLQQIIKRKKIDDQLSALQEQIELLSKERSPEHIVLTTKTEYLFVKPDEIVFCSADSNYTAITLLNKKAVLVTKSLCHFYKESLPFSYFIRISRSVVINKKYLVEVIKSERKCILKAGKHSYSFVISPEYYKALKNNNFSRFSSLNENIPSHTNILSLLNKNN